MHNKDILILTSVHGDEPIGTEVVEKLLADDHIKETFDHIIGNPEAVAQSKRFIDVDLNRIAPGDPNAKEYEARRAYELAQIIPTYKYVIDIHQTRANDRIIIILPHITQETLAFALQFDVLDILIWPPPQGRTTGPLIQDVPYSIGLEAGTKSEGTQTRDRLEKIIVDAIMKLKENPEMGISNEALKQRRFFEVYGKIQPEDIRDQTLADFEEIKGPKETFTALLFGRHQNILGYKMRRIDSSNINKYIAK